uniref:Virulence associated protein C n=1 Tax=Solibacter usitatus (strain Ellin6076) TaxID=234267 RepID=Q021Q2_SOLUE
MFVPAIALGELYFGAAKSDRSTENAARLEEFAAGRTIIHCDIMVAREYGRLKQCLKQKGTPLPENDIWIAAAATCHGMTLVTRDHHFDRIEGLQTSDWSTHPQ